MKLIKFKKIKNIIKRQKLFVDNTNNPEIQFKELKIIYKIKFNLNIKYILKFYLPLNR